MQDIDAVELDHAIDRQMLQEHGFEGCLQKTCASTNFDFLFQLPVFDQSPGQRIAALSTGRKGSLLYAVLNDAGDDIGIVKHEDMRPEISNFAHAFMDVFTRLGSVNG